MNGQGRKVLTQKFNQLKEDSKQYSSFENLDKRTAPEKANLKVTIDQRAAMASGLTPTDINSTLSAALGGQVH